MFRIWLEALYFSPLQSPVDALQEVQNGDCRLQAADVTFILI